jgi:tetratricopeptide (TPR) repeat protein
MQRATRTRGRALPWVSVIVLLASTPPAAAQMELAVFQGTIKDEAGAPLDGVTIRLRDVGRGRETVLKTDKAGKFYRRGLPAVEYEMAVEKDGYQPINDKVRLTTADERRLDFTLAKASPAGSTEFAKATAAYNAGDFAGAAQMFEAVLAKAPNQPEARINLALAYLRLKRPGDAAAQLEQVAAGGNSDARVQFQLGGAYVDMKQLDKAVTAFETGLGRQPDLEDPAAWEAAVTLGAVYFAQGEADKAASLFDKALAARPETAAPMLGLAKVHASKGDVQKALALFDKVVAAHPGTPEAEQAAVFIKELRRQEELAEEVTLC